MYTIKYKEMVTKIIAIITAIIIAGIITIGISNNVKANETQTEIIIDVPQTECAGDLNADNKVDAQDAALLLQYVAQVGSGKAVMSQGLKDIGDINQDGNVDSRDATWILRLSAATGADAGRPVVGKPNLMLVTGSINVRVLPDKNSRSIGYIQVDDIVILELQFDNGWYKVTVMRDFEEIYSGYARIGLYNNNFVEVVG